LKKEENNLQKLLHKIQQKIAAFTDKPIEHELTLLPPNPGISLHKVASQPLEMHKENFNKLQYRLHKGENRPTALGESRITNDSKATDNSH
jgi:hypothetical protein